MLENTHPSIEQTSNPNCAKQLLGEVFIDAKITELLNLSDEFIFPAYYSHEKKIMWKISNVFTHYGSETMVLCGIDEGIVTALDLAIKHISKAKIKFYKN